MSAGTSWLAPLYFGGGIIAPMLTWHALLLLSLLQRKGQGSFFPNPICWYNDIARISADVAVVLIPTIFYPIINPVASPVLRSVPARPCEMKTFHSE